MTRISDPAIQSALNSAGSAEQVARSVTDALLRDGLDAGDFQTAASIWREAGTGSGSGFMQSQHAHAERNDRVGTLVIETLRARQSATNEMRGWVQSATTNSTPSTDFRAVFSGVVADIRMPEPFPSGAGRRAQETWYREQAMPFRAHAQALAELVSERYPPGNPQRAAALAGAYQALADRFFIWSARGMDSLGQDGLDGGVMPDWGDMFRSSAAGRYECVCTGYGILARDFFQAAGMTVQDVHAMPQDGGLNGHHMTIATGGGVTIATSNNEARQMQGPGITPALTAFGDRAAGGPYNYTLDQN
jgi:hypothetical protein